MVYLKKLLQFIPFSMFMYDERREKEKNETDTCLIFLMNSFIWEFLTNSSMLQLFRWIVEMKILTPSHVKIRSYGISKERSSDGFSFRNLPFLSEVCKAQKFLVLSQFYSKFSNSAVSGGNITSNLGQTILLHKDKDSIFNLLVIIINIC